MAFAMKMNFVPVLVDGSLRHLYVDGQRAGFQVEARLGYYRGHYLSDIDEFWISVDGVKYDPAVTTFGINGKDIPATILNRCASEFWTLLEPAKIKVTLPGGIADGAHKVDLHLMLRVPYLPLPGGDSDHSYMPLDSCGSANLIIHD